jgi:hypothetical protein
VKRFLLGILILACIPVSVWLAANFGMWVQVLRYSGDGVIHAAPIMPGYQITFPKFGASQPYSASYRLSRVPQRKYGEPVIYLRFYWSRGFANIDQVKKQVTAEFRFTLLDEEGELIQSADLPVSASIWTGGTDFWGIYQLDQSRLRFSRDASYVLNVSYTPGAVPPPTSELYFSVEDGGTL